MTVQTLWRSSSAGPLIIAFSQVNTTVLAGESGHHVQACCTCTFFRMDNDDFVCQNVCPDHQFSQKTRKSVKAEIVLTIYNFL